MPKPPAPDILAQLLDDVTDAVCALDAGSRLSLFNRAAERFFGRDRGEVLGRPFAEVFPGDAGTVLGLRCRNLLAGGEPFTLESCLAARPDRTVEVRAARAGDSGITLVITDVTDRRPAGTLAEGGGDRLRLLVDNLPVGVNVMDREGNTLLSNPAFRGFLPEGVVPSRHPAAETRWHGLEGDGSRVTRDRFPAARALRGEPVRGLEFLHRGPDGRESWTRVSALPLLDEGDAVVGALSVIVDIDAEKRAQEALAALNDTLELQVAERTRELAESRRRLATLLDNLPGFAYRRPLGPDGGPTYVSEGVAAVTGHAAASFLGHGGLGWEDLVHPGCRERVTTLVREALAKGQPFEATYRIRARDGGERWLWERGRGIPGPDGRPVALEGFVSDVTERRRTEDALRQAQKMEAMGQLTGGIAHDFNNVLASVLAGFDLVGRQADRPEMVRSLAAQGTAAAERGARLAGQLLAFARVRDIEPRPLVVPDLVAGMRDMLGNALGSRVRLGLDLADGRSPVLADATQLEMALLNLAINARDAMPGGGDLDIATAPRRLAADPGLPDGDYVELSVADTGEGMPAEVLARAFDPFFTTKGVGKGTGLGLSQVYSIARQAGGTARIDSRPGEGTTVRLLLPALAAGTS